MPFLHLGKNAVSPLSTPTARCFLPSDQCSHRPPRPGLHEVKYDGYLHRLMLSRRFLHIDHAPAIRRDGSFDGLAGSGRFEQRAIVTARLALRCVLILDGFLRGLCGQRGRRCANDCRHARDCASGSGRNGQNFSARNSALICHGKPSCFSNNSLILDSLATNRLDLEQGIAPVAIAGRSCHVKGFNVVAMTASRHERLIHSGAAFVAERLANRCAFFVSRVHHQRRAKLSLRAILNARHHTNLRGHDRAVPGPTGACAL